MRPRRARARHRACHVPAHGVSAAAHSIGELVGARQDFGALGEFGRIAVNVETVYRTLDPNHQGADVIEQFRRMAALERPSAIPPLVE